ncbi:hypothetical protein BGW80DRAFT_1458312 [Lactifluus volemus]|nr:hypothetical protein BGW80DRAFT_1458312 [Lactifluus volemus]
MLQMLKSFFSIPRNGDPELHLLFAGLHIASRQDICTKHMGKYPVIFCDFKDVKGKSWDEMFWNFGDLVSDLYGEWEDCLMESLKLPERTYFESIRNQTATMDDLEMSLYYLSCFITEKFGQRVIVLIDEYEAPINHAYEHGYFNNANEFFGQGVLPILLKANESLQYAVLVGITPTAKSGWYGLNNLKIHALHTKKSPFAGMLMFTESEVNQLKTEVGSELELADLRAQYNSYIAGGKIGVYNPASVMSALEESEIKNFWVATEALAIRISAEQEYYTVLLLLDLATGEKKRRLQMELHELTQTIEQADEILSDSLEDYRSETILLETLDPELEHDGA